MYDVLLCTTSTDDPLPFPALFSAEQLYVPASDNFTFAIR